MEPCSACIFPWVWGVVGTPPEPSIEVLELTADRAVWYFLPLAVFPLSVGDGAFFFFWKPKCDPKGCKGVCSSSSSSNGTSESSSRISVSGACWGDLGIAKAEELTKSLDCALIWYGSVSTGDSVMVLGDADFRLDGALDSGAPHQGRQHFQAPTSVPTKAGDGYPLLPDSTLLALSRIVIGSWWSESRNQNCFVQWSWITTS